MNNQIRNFKRLISFFNKKGIDYVLLGKKNSLAEIVVGDIDLVVSVKDLKRVEILLGEFSKNNNLYFIQSLRHEFTAKYTILVDKEDHSIICPDFCSHYVRRSRFFIHTKKLLENTQIINIEGLEIKALTFEYEFLYYIIKKLDKGIIDESSYNHLQSQYNKSNNNQIFSLLSPYFSKRVAKEILQIFEKTNKAKLSKKVIEFKKALYKRKRTKVIDLFKNVVTKTHRIRNKTGLSIAILGSDGSGKSTVINGLNNGLINAFRQIHYYHLKPIDKKNKQNVNPQGSKPYSLILSIFKIWFLVLQYNFGYLKTRIKLIKSTLVIFDRYFDDIIVDPLRFRFGGTSWIPKLMLRIIPKPKLYFLLDCDAEIIYGRKKELSIEEINRQRKLYNAVLRTKKRGYVIDASNKPNDIVSNVEKLIFIYLEKRLKKRYSMKSKKYYYFPFIRPQYYFPVYSFYKFKKYYTPYSFRAKIVWFFFQKIGLIRWFFRISESDIPIPHNFIRNELDVDEFKLFYNLGTRGQEQKLTIIGHNKTSNFFAKIAVKERAKKLVENEIEALNKLQNKTNSIPSLIQYKISNQYVFFLTNLIKGAKLIHFKNTEILNKIYELNNHFPLLEKENLKYCFAHGDFCMWNMLQSNKDIYLIDWEMAGYKPLGYDLFTLVFQTSFLLYPKKGINEIVKEHNKLFNEYFEYYSIETWQPYLKAFTTLKVEDEFDKKGSKMLELYKELLKKYE